MSLKKMMLFKFSILADNFLFRDQTSFPNTSVMKINSTQGAYYENNTAVGEDGNIAKKTFVKEISTMLVESTNFVKAISLESTNVVPLSLSVDTADPGKNTFPAASRPDTAFLSTAFASAGAVVSFGDNTR